MIEPSNVELAGLPECSREYIADLEAEIERLRAALVAEQQRAIGYRDGLRVCVGLDTEIPWNLISADDPGGYVSYARRIMEEQT